MILIDEIPEHQDTDVCYRMISRRLRRERRATNEPGLTDFIKLRSLNEPKAEPE